MFIQTEATSDPATLKFLPGRTVLASGKKVFADGASAVESPLAQRLFEIEGVTRVALEADMITVSKHEDKDWQVMKPAILGVIMEQFTLGGPASAEEEGAQEDIDSDGDPEVVAEIKELIDTRVGPVAAQEGGRVVFRGFKGGVVFLELEGPVAALKGGIHSMLHYYVPEVVAVRDFRDATPKPGLETPEAQEIQGVLDDRVNPSVAAHGGYISLVDVQGDTAYIRLEGGCQGCGMADVTLKQGVEREIKRAVPAIVAVLDVTDHAGGHNPYYQPGKGGMSPL